MANKCRDCGAFLGNTKCVRCKRCRQLLRLKKDNDTMGFKVRGLQSELGDKARWIKSQETVIEGLKKAKEYPIGFKVKAASFTCGEEYLQKLLMAVAPFSSCIQIEWWRESDDK